MIFALSKQKQKVMKNNVGKTDRVARAILGLVIILIGVYFKTWWGAIGAGIILPGILVSDPLYTVLGINTNKK